MREDVERLKEEMEAVRTEMREDVERLKEEMEAVRTVMREDVANSIGGNNNTSMFIYTIVGYDMVLH